MAGPLGVVTNLQRHLSCLGAPSTVDQTVGRGASFMAPLPFAGGRVRFPGGEETYPNGKKPWRCSACGRVGPWQDGWGVYCCAREEDDGLYADHGVGYPVWCSSDCYGVVLASGAISTPTAPVVTRKRGR